MNPYAVKVFGPNPRGWLRVIVNGKVVWASGSEEGT